MMLLRPNEYKELDTLDKVIRAATSSGQGGYVEELMGSPANIKGLIISEDFLIFELYMLPGTPGSTRNLLVPLTQCKAFNFQKIVDFLDKNSKLGTSMINLYSISVDKNINDGKGVEALHYVIDFTQYKSFDKMENLEIQISNLPETFTYLRVEKEGAKRIYKTSEPVIQTIAYLFGRNLNNGYHYDDTLAVEESKRYRGEARYYVNGNYAFDAQLKEKFGDANMVTFPKGVLQAENPLVFNMEKFKDCLEERGISDITLDNYLKAKIPLNFKRSELFREYLVKVAQQKEKEKAKDVKVGAFAQKLLDANTNKFDTDKVKFMLRFYSKKDLIAEITSDAGTDASVKRKLIDQINQL